MHFNKIIINPLIKIKYNSSRTSACSMYEMVSKNKTEISQKFILVLHVVPPCYRPETTLVIRNRAIRIGWWRSRGHNARFWGPSRINDKQEQKREVTIVFVRGFTPFRCFNAVAQLWLTDTLTSGGLCTRTEP